MAKDIIKTRKAIDKYRKNHEKLEHAHGKAPDHSSIYTALKGKLDEGTFDLDEFFVASELMNIQNLGFADKADFESRATQADRAALAAMWR